MKKYGSYKDSGVKWLGEIPEHWDVRKIKNLFNEKDSLFIDGDWIESKDIFGEDVIYYTTGNIQELKFIEKDKSYITEETFDKLNCTEVLSGDILISRLNLPLGRCCIAPKFEKKSVVSVDVVVFRPDKIFNRAYLLYLMNSPQYFRHTEDEARGAIMKRISRSILGNIKIPIPPPEEQQAIANFLDDKTTKIDQAIAIKEKEITLLKERRQILIQELVTGKKVWDGTQWAKPTKTKDSGVDWIGEIPEDWEVRKLKSFCKAYGRIGFRGYTTADLVDEGEGAITISPSNIKENEMEFVKNSFLNWSKYNESPEIKIRENDILIVKTGSTYGKIGIVKNLPEKATINPQLLVLKNIKINSDYLYELLKSGVFQLQVERNVIGSTIPTISETKILGFSVPVPIDENEFNKLSEYIYEINAKLFTLIKIKQEEIEKLKVYKTVLIDNVVTGKVRVN